MLATAEPPTSSPHLGRPQSSGRKPLQPKNNLFITNNNYTPQKPNPTKIINHQPPPIILNNDSNNKENWDITPNLKLLEAMDASLAEELSAVKLKLERLKSDREKTRKMLQERDCFLQVKLIELHHRGEFQKELEIEVDRLYRLKQLKLACLRMSPIRSLRDKELEKKSKESQFELIISEKSGESKEELFECSTTESPKLSYASSSASTSASTNSKSTATSKMAPFQLRGSLESGLDDM